MGLDGDRSAELGVLESAEVVGAKNHLGAVLDAALRFHDLQSGTSRYSVVNPVALSEHFLGGKFWLTSKSQLRFQKQLQSCYAFAVMGEKSGNYDKTKPEQGATLADVINILCNHDDPQKLIDWIEHFYRTIFNVKLDPDLITLEWSDDDKKLIKVLYDAPSDFKRKIIVEIASEQDEKIVVSMGRISKEPETQLLLDDENRLQLPSGISPNYDVVIPASLLKLNPECTLPLGKNGKFGALAHVSAQMIADEVDRFRELESSSACDADDVNDNSGFMAALAGKLLEDIDINDHAKRIMHIVNFVKSFEPKQRFGFEAEHSGLLTIFNGGGHCQSFVILFAELMLAAGYDSGILTLAYVGDHELHALGGIPEKYLQYFPEFADKMVEVHGSKYILIDFNFKRTFGYVPESNEVILGVEKILSDPNPAKPSVKVEIIGRTIEIAPPKYSPQKKNAVIAGLQRHEIPTVLAACSIASAAIGFVVGYTAFNDSNQRVAMSAELAEKQRELAEAKNQQCDDATEHAQSSVTGRTIDCYYLENSVANGPVCQTQLPPMCSLGQSAAEVFYDQDVALKDATFVCGANGGKLEEIAALRTELDGLKNKWTTMCAGDETRIYEK